MAHDNPEALATELSVAALRLVRWLRAADAAPALSGPEASAMAVIVYAEGVTPSQLAELEQVKRPTVTRLVEGLVRRGLVRKQAHPEDKRSSLLFATGDGLRLWQAGQLRRIGPLAERIAGLKPEELRQIQLALPALKRLTEPPQ